jgi:2-C-methyl-D-erythritol 4-phosphate cytidylyltransferase/2-C-methyl-D-erythritol 2,4-cyclodiphosphate synthase
VKTFAVILAAGRGERMGFDKTHFVLRGRPIWRYSYDTFRAHPLVEGVGLVVAPEALGEFAGAGAEFVVAGGETRSESSRIGLEAVPEWADIVLIHDGARPFVSAVVIDRVIAAVESVGPATPGIPSPDTIKQQTEAGVTTLNRAELFATQTPQGALRKQLLSLYRLNKQEYTDDMALLESQGFPTHIVPGDPNNFKITTPEDLARAAALLGPPEIRTGLGYDIHRFSTDPERPMWLGGVKFDNIAGLEGHSDADAVLHAVVDSLLGAAALGDIGALFPDTDPQWKNAPSIQFVTFAGQELEQRGWAIVNIDISVIAEAPKVMPRSVEIRNTIAQALRVEVERISIKATTNEQLGSLGRREGIAAFAAATIRQRF